MEMSREINVELFSDISISTNILLKICSALIYATVSKWCLNLRDDQILLEMN